MCSGLLLASFVASGQLQRHPTEEKPTTRILFLVDGSGSMLADWEGKTRIDRAKELLTFMADSLKSHPEVELGLRVYGHQYLKKFQNCQDTKLEVPFSKGNHEALKSKIQSIQPKGVTPLAYSLEQAAGDFSKSRKYRNVIVILTDGLESCDGDPCSTSLALQRKRVFLKPFIIGLGLAQKYETKFDCMGKFYSAATTKDFRKVLNKVIVQTMAEASVRVDLLDGRKKPTVSNVNCSFINAQTGQVEYDFVHFLKPNGLPDEVVVDPVLNYHVRVSTIPPILKKNVDLDDPKLNIIKIPAAQGLLETKMMGTNGYGETAVLIRKKGEKKTIHSMNLGDKVPLLTGKYELEITTTPRIYKSVEISENSTAKINIFAPGILNFSGDTYGYGSIYQLGKNGRETWVYNLTEKDGSKGIWLQPGDYKIVFRSKKAMGSAFTNVKFVTIKAGSSTQTKL